MEKRFIQVGLSVERFQFVRDDKQVRLHEKDVPRMTHNPRGVGAPSLFKHGGGVLKVGVLFPHTRLGLFDHIGVAW